MSAPAHNLTMFSSCSPDRYRRRFSWAISTHLRRVISSRIPPPTWGVRSRLGTSHRGLSGGRGSGTVTSSEAPHSLPPLMARARASWSRTEPRPALIRMASSFIRAMRPASISPAVWGEWGRTRATTSARGRSRSSSSMGYTWSKPSTGPLTVRFRPMVLAPRPWHSLAKSLPT